MCVKCGKKSKALQAARAEAQLALVAKSQHSLLTYVGNKAMTEFYGDVTRRKYRFSKDVSLVVDTRDVVGFLALNKGGRRLFVLENATVEVTVIGEEKAMKEIEVQSKTLPAKNEAIEVATLPAVSEELEVVVFEQNPDSLVTLDEEEIEHALEVAIENDIEPEKAQVALDEKKTKKKKD